MVYLWVPSWVRIKEMDKKRKKMDICLYRLLAKSPLLGIEKQFQVTATSTQKTIPENLPVPKDQKTKG